MPVDSGSEPSAALLAWYDRHARRLPWRATAGVAPDPYRVWLSEVMLQQTTVAAVKAYFEAFTTRWPTVADLAAGSDDAVMSAWAGLGYYARARNLIACARMIAAGSGQFPDTEEGLRALPGVGRYTAAAIAAIAFGARAIVVDSNVERVVSRLFAVREALPGAREEIYRLTDLLTPAEGAGDFAQAMMDLGSAICTPKTPDCGRCPLAPHCAAFAEGAPQAYPVKLAKAERPRRRGFAYWLEHDGHVLLVRRPARGLLGGMMALPSGHWDAAPDPDEAAPAPADWRPAGAIEHVFTHFALELSLLCASAPDRRAAGTWWPIDRIGEAGLPTVFAKAAARGAAWREAA